MSLASQTNSINESPSERDMLNAVSEALYDLNRHYDAKTLPRKVLSLIARLIRCDSAACVRIDPATSSFSLLSWPDDTFSALDHDEVAR